MPGGFRSGTVWTAEMEAEIDAAIDAAFAAGARGFVRRAEKLALAEKFGCSFGAVDKRVSVRRRAKGVVTTGAVVEVAGVGRKCLSCKREFMAPSAFVRRCVACRELHAGWGI